MPTESELRALLRGDGAPGALDTDDIIRRARARRRPKQLAAGALGGLAALALVVPVVLSLGPSGPGSVSDSSGGAAAPAHSENADDATMLREGASDSDPFLGCGAPAEQDGAVLEGLELTLGQPAPGSAIVLTLMNGSAGAVHGELAGAPLVTVSDGERPLGWSSAAVTGESASPEGIALAPGEQRNFEVPLEIVPCADEAGAGEAGAGEAVVGEVELVARWAIDLADGTRVIVRSAPSSVVVGAAP